MKPFGLRISVRTDKFGRRVLSCCAILALLAAAAPVAAQQIRSGEAFVTRFSGTMQVPGPGGSPTYILNPGGVVGSVIDLRSPGQPPSGQHWIDEPQRLQVTAAEVGQVFGVAFDDANPPNVFVAATSAFGLHRVPGNAGWMPGMWGMAGGPGTVYRLSASNGYRPQPFANVGLPGRPNTGAALGNIAFDRWNRQLFVSDMETGMIHRLRLSDGASVGMYDHGVAGRANFFKPDEGASASLPPIPFDPASRARIEDCAAGSFEYSTDCWNLAASGRRVWGLGVWRSGQGEVRLYYSVWSDPAANIDAWTALPEEERRNSLWSVGIGPDGGFNTSSVRREFLMPDFFTNPEDIVRAGHSRPVSDVAFAVCPGRPLMLLAERGGMRNLGLDSDNAFATPYESRVLRYELHQDGIWRPIGRYEVGFYNRLNEGEPYLSANCAGGVSFGPNYTNRWTVNPGQPDQYVWMSADALCSPQGPCNLPAGQSVETGDDSEVHGLQGIRADLFAEVAPASAFGVEAENASLADQLMAAGPDEAYLVDVDINVDPSGQPAAAEFSRNDASRVGDVAVYQVCAPQPAGVVYPLPPPPVTIVEPGHSASFSHNLNQSHGVQSSHFRYGSHLPSMSHSRFGSHNSYWSHHTFGSHNSNWSHNRFGSHGSKSSHNNFGSHNNVLSHFSKNSKKHSEKQSHAQFKSHNAIQSIKDPDPKHSKLKSAIDDIKPKDPDPKHSKLKSAIDDIKPKDPEPKHGALKSAVDKIKPKDPEPKHGTLKSAVDKIKPKDPEPKHNTLKSAADKIKPKDPDPKDPDPKHSTLKSAVDKIKPKDPEPKHNPTKSIADKIKPKDPEPKHNPTKSIADKIKPKDPEPKHSTLKSAADNIKLKDPTPPPPKPKVIVIPKDPTPPPVVPKSIQIPNTKPKPTPPPTIKPIQAPKPKIEPKPLPKTTIKIQQEPKSTAKSQSEPKVIRRDRPRDRDRDND